MTPKVDAVGNTDHISDSDKDHTEEIQEDGSDSNTDYSDCSDEESRNEWRRYSKQVELGDYYNIEEMHKCRKGRRYVPHDLTNMCEDITMSAEFAIKEYNRKHKNEQLVLVKVLRLVVGACSGMNYFLTFEARSSTSGDVKVYQATIYYGPVREPELVSMQLRPENQDSSKG